MLVPPELRSELLTETHDGIFAGHFFDLKVYDKLQMSKSSVGAVSVVLEERTRMGYPSTPAAYSNQGPFHRVGVDVLTMPLSSSGNKYKIVIMDYLTKWVEPLLHQISSQKPLLAYWLGILYEGMESWRNSYLTEVLSI